MQNNMNSNNQNLNQLNIINEFSYGNNFLCNENYDLIVFKIFLNLYNLSKLTEMKLNHSLQIKEEYFLLHLQWLKDFKKAFNYQEIEKFFEEKCNTATLNLNLNKSDYIQNIYQESNFSNTKITKDKFDKINKIFNKENIFVQNIDFKVYKNYAIINKKTIEEMLNNNFYFDERPKTDIYIGNQSFILCVGKSSLECVFLKDYDNFIDEYLINFIDVKNREEAKKQIITLGLQYYFNVNKINKNSYVEQYIYDSKTNQKLATINNINNNKKKEIEENVLKAIINCYKEAYSDSMKKNKKKDNYALDAVSQLSETIIREKNLNNNNNNFKINNNNSNNKSLENNNNKLNIYGENINYVTKVFATKIISKKESISFKQFQSEIKLGLVNLGNSCYINSVLQCLCHIPELIKYFIRNIIDPFQSPLANALNFLIQAMYQQPSNNNEFPKLYKPIYLCNIVFLLNNNFSATQPNDAKDFLIYFIGRLHQELNKVEYNQINNNSYYNIIDNSDPLSNYLQYFASNYNSIISNIFNWTNQVKRTCTKCKSQILSYQTFPYLILDLENTRKSKYEIHRKTIISEHKNNETYLKKDSDKWFNEYYQKKENIPIDLIDCIKYYYEKQNYFEFFCPYCNNYCSQISTNRIYLSPNIFIFILNRGKNNIHSVKMEYPSILEIGDYIESNQSPNKYELIGVITHLGLSGPGGHFIAFCRDLIDEKWYQYNDEHITPASTFSVHNEGTAYILVYRFIKN